jgi:hypothetical protein
MTGVENTKFEVKYRSTKAVEFCTMSSTEIFIPITVYFQTVVTEKSQNVSNGLKAFISLRNVRAE